MFIPQALYNLQTEGIPLGLRCTGEVTWGSVPALQGVYQEGVCTSSSSLAWVHSISLVNREKRLLLMFVVLNFGKNWSFYCAINTLYIMNFILFFLDLWKELQQLTYTHWSSFFFSWRLFLLHSYLFKGVWNDLMTEMYTSFLQEWIIFFPHINKLTCFILLSVFCVISILMNLLVCFCSISNQIL